jgi:hypothetical protein
MLESAVAMGAGERKVKSAAVVTIAKNLFTVFPDRFWLSNFMKVNLGGATDIFCPKDRLENFEDGRQLA